MYAVCSVLHTFINGENKNIRNRQCLLSHLQPTAYIHARNLSACLGTSTGRGTHSVTLRTWFAKFEKLWFCYICVYPEAWAHHILEKLCIVFKMKDKITRQDNIWSHACFVKELLPLMSCSFSACCYTQWDNGNWIVRKKYALRFYSWAVFNGMNTHTPPSPPP